MLRQSASPGDGGSARLAALAPLPAAEMSAGDMDKWGRGARLRPPDGCDLGLGAGGVVGEGPGSEQEPLGV